MGWWLLFFVVVGADSFTAPRQGKVSLVPRRGGIVETVLADPTLRFSCVSALVSAALVSKVSHSPLQKSRKDWTKPANMSRTEWRREDIAKWRLEESATAEVAIFLRVWASEAAGRGELRFATVEAVDDGVRIKWVPRQKYLSSKEERRLEAKFEESRAIDLDVPTARSIYTYPARKCKTAAGGVDVRIFQDKLVTISRCAYASNEPVKEASERRLVALLDRDLAAAYGATLIQRGQQQSSPSVLH